MRKIIGGIIFAIEIGLIKGSIILRNWGREKIVLMSSSPFFDKGQIQEPMFDVITVFPYRELASQLLFVALVIGLVCFSVFLASLILKFLKKNKIVLYV